MKVDCYDGDTEPVVTHGKTLTASVPVRDVCAAIASYAFMASPYPVIISAEVHCGPQQQKVLVDILTEVFGDALVTAPLAAAKGLPEDILPSPEELKYKIMFKVCSSLLHQHGH
jgi:phosphatidylinositol phospholipase C delta